MRSNRFWMPTTLAFVFVLGWFAASLRVTPIVAEPAPAKGPAITTAGKFGCDAYMQTSAEYRACCLQIYRCAELRLEALLQSMKPKPDFPAIVLDLDETVLDNSPFQTFLHRNKLEYSDALWADYEENYPQDVRLIPGAKRFLDLAAGHGVTAIYISNRSETHRAATIKALERLGVAGVGIEQRLLLKPKDGPSDKSARREAVAAKYNVLMYFGDNLRDFSDAFAAKKPAADAGPADYRKAIDIRLAQTDAAVGHWGIDWWVLPNPTYGEWEKLLGPDPVGVLNPTSMKKATTK